MTRIIVAMIVLAGWSGLVSAAEPVAVDVCVYGSTSAGVAAAVAVSKAGKSVILIVPAKHLGGMSSGGLGETDFGNKAAIGGISREFYRRLGKFYGTEEAWKFQPHHAGQVFDEWVRDNKVRVMLEYRLGSVSKAGRRISAITVEKAPLLPNGAPAATAVAGQDVEVRAAMFIDATYEGDLLAKAGVSYIVGREAVSQHNEPLNGIRAKTPQHQFKVPVDPYLKPGDPASGLLPLIQQGDLSKAGEGDKSVQAYNFRLCLTKDPANKLPIAPPTGYDAKRYELLGRYFANLASTGKTTLTLKQFLKIDMMPGGKTDINNQGAVSTDFIGENYAYPDGDWATRSKIWTAHLEYIQGLLYFLATDERIPAAVREDMKGWGLCKDEFVDTAGWPHQMYVREARRMVGRYFITQNDCEHKTTIEDSVGMGAYNMDSHNCRRLVIGASAENEGDVQVGPKGPYPIPYRAITPKAEECENLLVPVCVSSSHIAYGSIRMEPVFMALAESSAIAACQAIDEKTSVQEISYPKLKEKLLSAGQVLSFQRPVKK